VFADPLPAEVLDQQGRPVEVSGRGMVSAPPVSLCVMSGDESTGWRRGPVRPVTAWAGPWPIEERWWEPNRHRRLAQFQILAGAADVEGQQTGDQDGYLVIAEHRRWWISARYD
jgi:protein ImuB